ncbi:flagellar protein FliT [Heyndrickxia oleronia]|uniref:flagellar protein FliT n=1 Tax=Heyndrickxia oleronia TaxID=38875 RepID=UPI00203B16E4|nr:flagellar protein FliT [Heyndrickxia oleronia]MCM3238353.1 flagellar protein FliT [Heyndrickxia oleronia]
MNFFHVYYQLTDELISTLRNISQNNRDEAITLINDLLNKREQTLSKIQPPFSDEEKHFGAKLVQMEKTLKQLLEKEKQSIQGNMAQLSKTKTSMNKYINPYQNMQTDGYFYDKRK